MLGRSNALISGSFALQFFERVVWPESDLDIMIPEGHGLEEMAGFLIDKEGYRLDSETETTVKVAADHYPSLDVTKCQTYLSEATGTGSNQASERKVQLVVTSGPPVQAILRGYYTTAVINFISWNKAYSVFPRATFLLHETVPLKSVRDSYGPRYVKLSKRGWRLRTEAVYSSGADNEQPLGYLRRDGDRRIGDRDTWMIRLDGATQVETSASFVPDSVLEYSGFRVGDLNLQARSFDSMEDWQSVRDSLAVSITAEPRRSNSLRHQYTSGSGTYWNLFWDALYQRTRQNTLGQLCKMKDSEIEAIAGSQLMMNHKLLADERKTVEDYGLRRGPFPLDPNDLNYMEPYLGQEPYNWQSYMILPLQTDEETKGSEDDVDEKEDLGLNWYAISLSHEAYSTMYVKLTNGDQIGAERLTEMQYRDMVIDNVRAAGGDMRAIRFLGTWSIQHRPARAAIAEAFRRAGRDILARGVVEVTPEDGPAFLECVRNNPFARGQQALLERHAQETGGAFVERFVFVSEGYDAPPGSSAEIPPYEPRLHMVTELGRPSS
ncbi:hypothetical protein DL769_004948 [Monosporascus sp. CRB-8-3]|nr:hypothetical protein DL769_004948 [Monosporascus sp. CRB-8-3]